MKWPDCQVEIAEWTVGTRRRHWLCVLSQIVPDPPRYALPYWPHLQPASSSADSKGSGTKYFPENASIRKAVTALCEEVPEHPCNGVAQTPGRYLPRVWSRGWTRDFHPVQLYHVQVPAAR